LARGNRSKPGSERTAEERERDREERANRRAGVTAEPVESPPAVEVVPPAPAPVQQPVEIPPPPAPRRSHGRSLGARVGALVALAAVIAAVWLLVSPLHGSGHPRTVALPAVVKVAIPEGETRLQIAELAATDGLSGSYRAASVRSSLLNPATYGASRHTSSLEGLLFPATYEMDAGAPASRLVAEQLAAFRERFGAEEIRRAHALHVTPYQMLTVASMVEREAQLPGDRPRIAAVIYNRLRQNMPLGIDATIYYAVELAKGIPTYTHELTEAQLHIDSPYNTRTHRGLPPTPISNPGMASIEAAAHPAHVPYLYYVAGADGCGEQVFSTTGAQFERDAAAYDAAVKKNGGKPPVCKKK
jgi:cell division protein YceG involved in septum cleavage